MKIIRRFCKLFGQDERTMVRIAWVDKAPPILKDEARQFLTLAETPSGRSVDLVPLPLVNTIDTGYTAELTSDGQLKPAVQATLVLPPTTENVELAATVCDTAMEQEGPLNFVPGDIVLLAREEKLVNGSLVYAVFTTRSRRRALFRQIMLDQNDHLVLQPLNLEFPLEFLSHDDLDVVYRVVGRIGSLEGSAVNSRV